VTPNVRSRSRGRISTPDQPRRPRTVGASVPYQARGVGESRPRLPIQQARPVRRARVAAPRGAAQSWRATERRGHRDERSGRPSQAEGRDRWVGRAPTVDRGGAVRRLEGSSEQLLQSGRASRGGTGSARRRLPLSSRIRSCKVGRSVSRGRPSAGVAGCSRWRCGEVGSWGSWWSCSA